MNYTRYDVRRAEDTIHIGTTGHRNVMVLDPSASGDNHQFWYAQVLAIYHANVIYIADGNTDFSPRRLDFLWVRWYDLGVRNENWSTCQLDRVSFPPMADEHSFGFLDPDDVLRGCHLIPVFHEGKARQDGQRLSFHAQDHLDWKSYVVNR